MDTIRDHGTDTPERATEKEKEKEKVLENLEKDLDITKVFDTTEVKVNLKESQRVRNVETLPTTPPTIRFEKFEQG